MSATARLAHRVAERFGCSRQDAERYVQNGWVTVDGVVVEAPQQLVSGERIELDPEARADAAEPATLLLHKPVGFDALRGARQAAALAIPGNRWADDPSGERLLQRHFSRLTPLVPLDREDSGLLVLTQDGRVWRRLSEDADSIEHEYLVETAGEIGPYGLRKLNHGLVFEGVELPPCKVSWQNETRLRFAIKAARPGQLRAMCAQVGLQVVAIRRLRIGRVPLGKLPVGQWRYLPVGEKF